MENLRKSIAERTAQKKAEREHAALAQELALVRAANQIRLAVYDYKKGVRSDVDALLYSKASAKERALIDAREAEETRRYDEEMQHRTEEIRKQERDDELKRVFEEERVRESVRRGGVVMVPEDYLDMYERDIAADE